MGTTESKSDPEKPYSIVHCIVIKYSVVIKCCDSNYLLGF